MVLPGLTVTTLPFGRVIVFPFLDPRTVVLVALAVVGHGDDIVEAADEALVGAEDVILLGPSISVITLPFGSVVNCPVPQSVESVIEGGDLLSLELVIAVGRMVETGTAVCTCCMITVTVTVVLEFEVTVLAFPSTVMVVAFPSIVTVLAGPFSPGVKFEMTPGVLVRAAGEAGT